jgi:hypothetical protein
MREAKRDPDLEREILAIEADDGTEGHVHLSAIEAPARQINYQVLLLSEADLVRAVDVSAYSEKFAMLPIRLTMADHEYLDAIRDDEVWHRTKEGARHRQLQLGDTWALSRRLVREKIRQHTGVEVDL